MNRKRVNPITIRSKKLIVDALERLMEEHPYSNITIKAICSEADLVRKTFYNNFSSKDEVLEYKISILVDEIMSKIESDTVTSTATAIAYFHFWYQHQEFITLLDQNNIFHILLQEYDKYMPILDEMVERNEKDQESIDFKKYHNSYNVAGLWHILKRWIESGCDKTPEEMTDIYLKILQGVH